MVQWRDPGRKLGIPVQRQSKGPGAWFRLPLLVSGKQGVGLSQEPPCQHATPGQTHMFVGFVTAEDGSEVTLAPTISASTMVFRSRGRSSSKGLCWHAHQVAENIIKLHILRRQSPREECTVIVFPVEVLQSQLPYTTTWGQILEWTGPQQVLTEAAQALGGSITTFSPSPSQCQPSAESGKNTMEQRTQTWAASGQN